MDTAVRGQGGMNGNSSIDICTIMCKIVSGKLLYNTGNLPKWVGWGQGRKAHQGGMYVCMCIYIYMYIYNYD